jgi:hypothetical protein
MLRASLTPLLLSFLVACGGTPGPAKEAKPAGAPVAASAAAGPGEAGGAAKPAAPKPAEAAAPELAIGQQAPEFTLTDLEGKTHALTEYRGKTVVLEWFNPECPFVKYAHGEGPLKDMAARLQAPDLVWLSINSGAPGKQGHGLDLNKKSTGEYGMKNPVLLDEDGRVGRLYGAQKTPHMYVIDASGKLVYRGGLDNAPHGEVDPGRPKLADTKEGARASYVEAALADIRAGRPVALAETPAYGCSVKYAS